MGERLKGIEDIAVPLWVKENVNWRDRQEVSDSVGAFVDVIIFIQKF
jgi:hypothetical protein